MKFISKYKTYFIAAPVFVAAVAAIMIAMMAYNSKLHIDNADISKICGMKASIDDQYGFDDKTVKAVRDGLNEMKYTHGGDAPIWQTYIHVEMNDGKSYNIKFAGDETVYIDGDAKRVGYYSCSSDISAIAKEIESRYGLGIKGITVQ